MGYTEDLLQNETLLGIINSWNQSDRTLRDIDNNVLITTLPRNYNPEYGLPFNVISNVFDSPDDRSMLEEYNRRVREQNES